ncbi:MAG: hypothetical protein ACTSYS_13970 [Promethearchaeota archaeon]
MELYKISIKCTKCPRNCHLSFLYYEPDISRAFCVANGSPLKKIVDYNVYNVSRVNALKINGKKRNFNNK